MLFGFQLKKGAVEFSKIENDFFRYFFEILQKEMPRECCWLSDEFFKDLIMMWAPVMTENIENGIMGCWGPDEPNKVFVAPPAITVGLNNPDIIYSSGSPHPEYNMTSELKDINSYINTQYFFGNAAGPLTLTHECYHRWQFKQFPFLFMINRLFTLLVDNPIFDAIFGKISDKKCEKAFKEGNYEYVEKEEDKHLPFLYKLTMEYDADRSTDHNPEMIEIVNKLTSLYFNYDSWVRQKYTADIKTKLGLECTDEDGKPITWYQNSILQSHIDALNDAEQKYINYVAKLFNIATDHIFEDRYVFHQN